MRVKLIEAPADSAELAASADNDASDRVPPRERPNTVNVSMLGMRVQDVTPDFARAAQLPANQVGARVMEVDRNMRLPFRGNGTEIITAVLFPRPRQEIRSAEELRTALAKVKSGDSISLLVYDAQQQGTRVVSITIGDQ